ncbi:MAG: lycopene cyclase domain-containing protein [Candidatus Woesearchaeota archaeon]
MNYKYTYLLMGMIFFIFWMILFLWRKDTRKEMIIMSIIFGFAGPIADILYTKDWWHPLTLTNTIIGPEAILTGFVIGGVTSVIYEDIFKKKIKIRNVSKTEETRKNFNFILIITISVFLFFGSFYLLNFNSLTATILALLTPTIMIWINRKDLILDSLATGVFLVITACLVYNILEFLTPGWVSAFWHFKNVPNIIILNVPIDDIIWYFLAGLFIGPLYEFWKEGKIANQI